MASYTVETAKHATLTAATVDTITMTGSVPRFEVKNRGTGDIYFRVDGVNPTVGGDDTYIVCSGEALQVPSGGGPDSAEVRLISAATIAYSVTEASR